MTEPQLLVTDESGAVLDTRWAKRLLDRHGLKLQLVAERDDDIFSEGPYHAPPPELRWTISLIRAGTEDTLSSLECDGRTRVRAAKQLLVALDVGLLP